MQFSPNIFLNFVSHPNFLIGMRHEFVCELYILRVCEGINIKNERSHNLQRKRIVGDLHGQASIIFCATVLLR